MNGFLSQLYWSYLANPAEERAIYSAVLKHRPSRIVEIGLGTAQRAEKLLKLVKSCGVTAPRYVGVDLFEGRSEGVRGVGLKDTYKILVALGADVKLIPGDAATVLRRISNALQANDLLLIDAAETSQTMAEAWMYVPRMLAAQALVFQAQGAGKSKRWQAVPLAEVNRRGLTAHGNGQGAARRAA